LDKQIQMVQQIVDDMLAKRESLRVLEAGCGSRSFIQFGPKAYLVGIDISAEQLQKNNLLQEKILGDIQEFPLQAANFDVVICWDVLEHLPQPEMALNNFLQTIKPGGIIVLGAPVVSSLKGLATKYTPHWLHVMLYRKVIGNPLAGTPGYGPFKTFLKSAMSPKGIRRFAVENHLRIDLLESFEGVMQQTVRRKYPLVDLVFRAVAPLVRVLSFGTVTPHTTDFIAVLRKPAPDARDRQAEPAFAGTTVLNTAH